MAGMGVCACARVYADVQSAGRYRIAPIHQRIVEIAERGDVQDHYYLTAHFVGGKLDGKTEPMRITQSIWERGTLWAIFRNGETYSREIYRRESDNEPIIYNFESREQIEPPEQTTE